jgi:type IV pilus assembly protein PilM
VGNVEGRIRWLELLKAIDTCLPYEPGKIEEKIDPAAAKPDAAKEKIDLAKLISGRNELHVTNLECAHVDDVSAWYGAVKQYDQPSAPDANASPAAATSQAPGGPASPSPVGGPAAPAAGGDSASAGPTGPGYIVRLVGFHYHNANRNDQGAQFVRRTLIDGLRKKDLMLPVGDGSGAMEKVTMKELGVSYPVLVNPLSVKPEELVDPNAPTDAGSASPMPGSGVPMPGMPMPGMGGMGGNRGMPGMGGYGPPGMGPRPGSPTPALGGAAANVIKLDRFDFDVQFCWQPKTPSERHDAKKAMEGLLPGTQPPVGTGQH